jgi:SNF2 family DNA or RNA helicase
MSWHIEKKYSVNAFVMGLGKTAVALGMHQTVGGKTLVVCPKYLITNWREELDKFKIGGHVEFVNYAMFKTLPKHAYDLVIVDEAHYLKTVNSVRSRRFYDYISTYPPDYLLMLTATPCKNDVSELYNLLRLCNIYHGDKAISRFRGSDFLFKRRYMKEYIMRMGSRTVKKYSGFINRDEYKELGSRYILKKRITDVQLPPVVNQTLTVGDFSLDHKFEKLENKFDKKAYMTVKKESAMRLAQYTAKHAQTMDGQVVIFTDHVKSAEKIAEKLEVMPIHGGVNATTREHIIGGFKEGRAKYLVATYKTAGVGLTLVNANYMIFNDLPFIPADLEQAKGRIRRIGQEKTCFYYYLGMSEMYFKLQSLLERKTKVLVHI